jgi:hypothetical protein
MTADWTCSNSVVQYPVTLSETLVAVFGYRASLFRGYIPEKQP